MNKWILIGVGAATFIGFLIWLFIASSQPLPGQKIAYNCSNFADFSKLTEKTSDDKCRVHVPSGFEINYQTNPPVFGPHDQDWTRAGVYDQPEDDRNMVHSLEHGYVIMHFKCQISNVILPKAGYSSQMSDEEATESGEVSQECEERKSQLSKIYEKKGKHKLIVVPRSNLETNFALTAWGYIDKFADFDGSRIEKFIDAHLEQGPEKTMEP